MPLRAAVQMWTDVCASHPRGSRDFLAGLTVDTAPRRSSGCGFTMGRSTAP